MAGASRFAAAVAIVVVIAGLTLLPQFSGEYGVQIGFRLLIYIVLGEAWNLLAGYCGLVSLGTSSFIGIGAYVLVGVLNAADVPISITLVGSGLVAAIVAFVVSPALFRLRGLYFTVGTLALGEALRLFMINASFSGGAGGWFLNAPSPSTNALFYYAIGLLAAATIVISACTQTRFSILLRSVRDDEDAATQMGVRAFHVKLAAFIIASFLMGAAGGLQAYKLGAIEPYGMFGMQWTIDVLSLVIIGGLGLRLGPVVGAIIVIALGEYLADYPELHIAITGVILIVIVRFAPKGILGLGLQLARWLTAPRPASGALRSGAPR
ncbi:branched-chain amino acid ABC transporter permease [Methylocapsa sp. S129]|uniref:branched-chain amino acid ABC transporter permease n=1 Tax=Methylocapsa sp. S129 TaxID=1641869 RepID=UPI00131CD357|nr:branched-chain amino acid ABC transporter permease [Methylocapsa sp. S129]